MKKDTLKKEEEKIKAAVAGFANPNPNRDWLVVLGLSFILFVLVIFWSVAAYFIYQPQTGGDDSVVLPPQTFDKKKITDVLGKYAKRQQQFDAIEAGSSTPFVDPSL